MYDFITLKSSSMKKIILILFLSVLLKSLQAQTPTDAIMMKQKESCFALIYEKGSFDKYWEGTDLRSNATIATVSRYTILPMIAIGIHDKVNLIIGAPYVKTESSEPNGGKFEGAEGFQDISFTLKGEIVKKQLGSGKIVALASVGYSTPITNYLCDYRPYSIGAGCNEFIARGIVQYKFDMGLYARSSVGYLWRGQTKAERDYYYANGSFYTPWMDVPNAWNYDVVAGMWLFDNSLSLEARYIGLRSSSGDDIRKYNAAQPTNRVNEDALGFRAQYYFRNVKGLGVLAYYTSVINGRNTAEYSGIGGGLTYQFKI
jgi:hypothetical protein